MKLICKKEPRMPDGKKVMEFTKGKTYYAEELFDDGYIVEDDNGKEEYFFNLNVIFDKI